MYQSQNQQKQPRKKYTEIQGILHSNPKYSKKMPQLPNLWIDSNDIETIQEYCKFWRGHFYYMRKHIEKLDKKEKQEHYKMMHRCVETCQLQKYKVQVSNLNYFIRQMQADLDWSLDFQLKRNEERKKKKEKRKKSNCFSSKANFLPLKKKSNTTTKNRIHLQNCSAPLNHLFVVAFLQVNQIVDSPNCQFKNKKITKDY